MAYCTGVKKFKAKKHRLTEQELDKFLDDNSYDESLSGYELIWVCTPYDNEYENYKEISFDSDEGKKHIVTKNVMFLMNDEGKTIEKIN